jgi:hypothetical protein
MVLLNQRAIANIRFYDTTSSAFDEKTLATVVGREGASTTMCPLKPAGSVAPAL